MCCCLSTIVPLLLLGYVVRRLVIIIIITIILEDNHSLPTGWGVLLIDASNAFNSLNRAALLWNVRILWLRCSRFVFNTYRGWTPLIVRGTEELLLSHEDVTQGDPLSMFLYAVATLPLIRSLKNPD